MLGFLTRKQNEPQPYPSAWKELEMEERKRERDRAIVELENYKPAINQWFKWLADNPAPAQCPICGGSETKILARGENFSVFRATYLAIDCAICGYEIGGREANNHNEQLTALLKAIDDRINLIKAAAAKA